MEPGGARAEAPGRASGDRAGVRAREMAGWVRWLSIRVVRGSIRGRTGEVEDAVRPSVPERFQFLDHRGDGRRSRCGCVITGDRGVGERGSAAESASGGGRVRERAREEKDPAECIARSLEGRRARGRRTEPRAPRTFFRAHLEPRRWPTEGARREARGRPRRRAACRGAGKPARALRARRRGRRAASSARPPRAPWRRRRPPRASGAWPRAPPFRREVRGPSEDDGQGARGETACAAPGRSARRAPPGK